jgi:hypothetical protein
MAEALNAARLPTRVLICRSDYERLAAHLFPGDGDEHGAVLAAGIVETGRGRRLLVQEVFPARDGVDYLPGKYGYRALQAQFIYQKLYYCRERGLCYLAVHNHAGRDYVGFSETDRASHRRGYPALLDLARGLPVGALVFAENAAAGELWLTPDLQVPISEVRVVGDRMQRLYSAPRVARSSRKAEFDRQILMFGELGQELLGEARIGILGAGGAGSIENELAAYLGAGIIVIADPDRLELSNRSRVVGSIREDCPPEKPGQLKVHIAERVARRANPEVAYTPLPDNVAYEDVAAQFRDCDFLFLAADSMQSRLLFNALIHQYLIPGIQVGTKVVANADGSLDVAFTVVRWITPDKGCLLCNGLIDSGQLALEAKEDRARREQDYGTRQPNPSVITMNAVAAGHAVNDFMMAFLGLVHAKAETAYRRFDHILRRVYLDEPRKDDACTECGREGVSRFGMGDRIGLPVMLQRKRRR